MLVKEGWKTTEFWFSTVVALWGIIMASGAVDPDNAIVKLIGGAVAAIASAGYAHSRGKTKAG